DLARSNQDFALGGEDAAERVALRELSGERLRRSLAPATERADEDHADRHLARRRLAAHRGDLVDRSEPLPEQSREDGRGRRSVVDLLRRDRDRERAPAREARGLALPLEERLEDAERRARALLAERRLGELEADHLARCRSAFELP